jgi:N-ethylmaleimide reductase
MTIFEPVKLGSLNLRNKIFMAPMTRSRADNPDAVVTKRHAEYYSQRASAGLIISEGTVVSKHAVGYVNVPGIYSEKQTEAWKKVTSAVHEKGGHIYAQLWHVGRISHPDLLDGELPLAPSAINPNKDVLTYNGRVKSVTPKELTVEEIKNIILEFKNAAVNAITAGFDGIEIHASNGYLFHQFFNNVSNKRNDEYGGNDENKTRFLFEVLDCLKNIMPKNKIGVRLNPMMHGFSGIIVDEKTADTINYIVEKLNDYNLAYLHLSRPPKKLDEPYFINDVIGHYRKIYNGILIANGNYNLESAEKEIIEKRADAVAFGVPFIANPDLVERFKYGYPLAEADKNTFYTNGDKGYIDYPRFDKSNKLK